VMILLILVPLAFYYRSSSDRGARGGH